MCALRWTRVATLVFDIHLEDISGIALQHHLVDLGLAFSVISLRQTTSKEP
jgi:FixJ family two-component response regulator